jgi:hypothetical protein
MTMTPQDPYWAATQVGKVIEPDTWPECLDLLLRNGGPDVCYRGLANYDFLLNSTLDRALYDRAEAAGDPPVELLDSMVLDDRVTSWALRVERSLLERFCDMATAFGIPGLPDPGDRLGWWELMQHHRAPTRLLDWTRSPLVALWFAFCEKKPNTGDAALWVIDTRNCEMNLIRTLGPIDRDGDLATDGRAFQNRLVDMAIEGKSIFPVPVRPRILLARAAAQQSVMTALANIPYPRTAGHTVRAILATKVRVKELWCEDILAACRSFGIHRVSLFRDLDTLGETLAECVKNSTPFPSAF